jgi:hypothetical protein
VGKWIRCRSTEREKEHRGGGREGRREGEREGGREEVLLCVREVMGHTMDHRWRSIVALAGARVHSKVRSL